MSQYYLNVSEVQAIRDAMAARRGPGTYEPGKWAVSAYNRDPKALAIAPTRFPESVMLRDITLRTMEQKPGVFITSAQRRRMAEALMEIGVPSIQLAMLTYGLGAGGGGLKDEVRFMRSLGSPVQIYVDGVNTRKHVELVAEAGVDVAQFLNMSTPEMEYLFSAEAQQARQAAFEGRDWRKNIEIPVTLQAQLEHIEELVGYCKKYGLKTSASINILAYVNEDYLDQYVPAVAGMGVDFIGLYDGTSGMGPEAWRYVVSYIKRLAPNLKIGVHTHNIFGLAAASAYASIQAGAAIAEVSVNGMCSASGQADLAEVAATLEVLYGVKTGVRMEGLTALRRLAEDMTGFQVANNKPITGERVFCYTEEVILSDSYVDPLLRTSVNPELFGNKATYSIGRGSGPLVLERKLRDLGIEVDNALLPALLQKVKEESELRGALLSDAEIVALVRRSQAPSETDRRRVA